MKNIDSFLSAILHVKEVDRNPNIWTMSVCRAFETHSFNKTPYHLGQLLEPSILYEVSSVTGISLDQILNLDYPSNGPMKFLQERLANIHDTTPVEKLNLAFRLIALSRFKLASHTLSLIQSDHLQIEDRVYFHLLRFLVKNRLSQPFNDEFYAMKKLFEENTLPNILQLKISAQAIVWEMKQRGVGQELFDWYTKRGLEASDKVKAEKSFSNLLALSTFHRAYAMVPANDQLIEETRKEMKNALDYATLAKPQNRLDECRKLDALKTCYESELKEHLYLSRNYDRAEQAGFNLINTDPNWSISYHEMGELYLKLNKVDQALSMFRKAAELGLPRITFTHFMLGYYLSELNREEEAISEFIRTLEIDPSNISAGINGFNLSRKIKHHSEKLFQSYLERWENEGILKKEQKEFIAT